MAEITNGRIKGMREWVTPTDCGCCFIHTTMFTPDPGFPTGDVFVGQISTHPSCLCSWKERIKGAWQLLRGKPYYEGCLEFYTKESGEEFIKDLQEALKGGFGE